MYLSAVVILVIVNYLHYCNGILAEDTATIIDAEIPGRQNDKFSNAIYPYVRGGSDPHSGGGGGGGGYADDRIADLGRRCSDRLETALDNIRRRQASREHSQALRTGGGGGGGGESNGPASSSSNQLHLDGYSLHQPLRSAPFDMYVTDMRVRLPSGNSWVHVDSCRYDPRNSSLQTRISFNDLTISGKVNLLNDNDDLLRHPGHNGNDGDLNDDRYPPYRDRNDACKMILRLRRAGIGFHTEPIRRERGQFNVRTDSHFLEPGFISVYAYGCAPTNRYRTNGNPGNRDRLSRRQWRHPPPPNRDYNRDTSDEDNDDDDEDISREMEDIFLKGIRSLLTTYMQKELQPAIKETLMTNMGYTVSYG